MLTKRHVGPTRLVLGLAPAVLVASGMGVALTTSQAAAEPEVRCGASCGDDNGGSEGESGGEGISVRVWGSGTTVGEEGYEIPAETVTVLPTCYYNPFKTGKEYYEDYEPIGPDNHPQEPLPDYEEYKDDDQGYWWLGRCSDKDYDGDDFAEYSTDWHDENPPLYIEEGEPEPVPPIPPEVLMEVAYDEMTLPEPEIAWNPKRDGDSATFVNLETWLWMEDGPVQLEVNAEAGGNTARVEATLGSLNFSAANAEPISCSGTGVEWTPGAESTDCALEFQRSSANQPGGVSSVTAQSQWDVEWFANGEPQGALDPQTTSGTFDLPVAEVQSVVTD